MPKASFDNSESEVVDITTERERREKLKLMERIFDWEARFADEIGLLLMYGENADVGYVATNINNCGRELVRECLSAGGILASEWTTYVEERLRIMSEEY